MYDKKNLKILFAINFSVGSKIALKTLNILLKKYKSDVSMIHVVESFWKDWINHGLYQKEATQRLKAWRAEYLPSADPKKIYTKSGNPAEKIIDTARRIKSNLILMGGRVADEAARYQTGTAIESVVRSTTKSVWICQRETISKILCGIDGSPSSAKALNTSIDLAKKLSAQLCIIHAVPSYLPAFGMSKKEIEREGEKFKSEYTAKLQKFINSFNLKKIESEVYFKWGMPANIILDHAEDFDCDLVVIGAKGHSKLHHVLIGSTAEKVLRYAPCSLLVVR